LSRPLLISDCDDVILQFAPHFAEWIAEAHGFHFDLDSPAFSQAVRDKDGKPVARDRVWPLLALFFDGEMHRQHIVPGALDALRAIGEQAEIVILTNIGDQYHSNRVAQLERFDIRHRILCNQGGKGRAVRELLDEMTPSAAVFVDDLPHHHESVADHAPEVWRLHMIAEARVAATTPPAPFADARIDDWGEALPWILARLNQEVRR
jgi:FMN phosphatase YigB (HAD superfamily)